MKAQQDRRHNSLGSVHNSSSGSGKASYVNFPKGASRGRHIFCWSETVCLGTLFLVTLATWLDLK